MEGWLEGAPEPALVGFSGGADSTALLLLLREAGWNDLLAVHFNHHLRGADADNDRLWCERFCLDRHISFICKDLYVSEARLPGESVETAARRCRLEAWRRLAAETGRRIVFLGHHADDALEEFLLRLGRGSNASGLTSLCEESYFAEGGYAIRRPLLKYGKAELEAYLRGQGVADWRVDATNLEPCCRRNAVRHRLIPLIRDIFGTDKGFRRSLRVLRDDAEVLEDGARRAEKDAMDLAAWQALPKAYIQRLLPEQFPDVPFSCHTVDRLYEALRKEGVRTRCIPLDAKRMMCLSERGLEVVGRADNEEESDDLIWPWQSSPCLSSRGKDGSEWEFVVQNGERPPAAEWGEHFDFEGDSRPAALIVRPWRRGDRVRPFGLKGHHRKLQDIFSDAHIPPEARHAWPVVTDDKGEILWVPGLVRAEIGRMDHEKYLKEKEMGSSCVLSLWARRC